MARKRKGSNVGAAAAAGVAAIGAAAAAGYYFYASDDAKKHRKQAAKWAGGFKKEVIREAKMLKTIDARSISRAVDAAAASYATVRSVDRKDLARAAKELKANWQRIQAEAVKTRKAVRKVAKAKTKVKTKAKRRQVR